MKVQDLSVFQELKKIGEPYIVGSYVLYSVYDLDYLAKDVDVCILTNRSVKGVKRFLMKMGCKILRRTKLGGIKVEYKGVIYDVWRMQDTVFDKYDEILVKERYPTQWFIEGLIFKFSCNIMHCWISPDDDEIYYDAWFGSFLERGCLETAITPSYNVLELDKKARKAIERIKKRIKVVEFDFELNVIQDHYQDKFNFLGIRNSPLFENPANDD